MTKKRMERRERERKREKEENLLSQELLMEVRGRGKR